MQQDCITWARVNGRLKPVGVTGKFKWTDQLDATLRELGRDHSASEIGAILGCSRNAVIGRCFRKGIALKGTEARRAIIRKANADASVAALARAQERLRRAQERRDAAVARAKPSVAVTTAEDAPPVDWHPARLSFADLRDGQCRWPLWPNNTAPSEKRYCGNLVEPGQSYCSHCSGLSYSPAYTRDIDRKLNLKAFARRVA